MAKKTYRPGRNLVIFFLGVGVLYGLVALGGNWKPELGLDLQGGTRITLIATGNPSSDAMNEARLEAGLPVFANPRNTTSGALRQIDASISANRPLRVLCYGLGLVQGPMPYGHVEVLQRLTELGLPVAEGVTVCTGQEEIQAAVERWAARRAELEQHVSQ